MRRSHPPAVVALFALALVASSASGVAAGDVETHTRYDEETSVYGTDGRVTLGVPIGDLARVAAGFSAYRTWALRGINGDDDNSRDFITLLRDVDYRNGGRQRVGVFEIEFDVDLIWPFGSEGNVIAFDLVEARHVAGSKTNGVDRIRVVLSTKSAVLETFSLTLEAKGKGEESEVRFTCRVKFVGLIDTFFSMKRYKKNIEWRIVKVVKNLKYHLERERSP